MSKILKWIDHNRFVVILPGLAIAIWLWASYGCAAHTISPTDPARTVNALELQTEFKVWQLQQEQILVKFEAARADLEAQKEQWSKFEEILVQLASGSVTNWGGLMQLLIAGGGLGAIGDNVRKRGLIAGLKRNNKK